MTARLQHHLDTEDAQQLEQAIDADPVGVALQGGERLLGNAEALGELALGQPGLLPEALNQGGQLFGCADCVLIHFTHPEL